MLHLRSKTGQDKTLSSPLRIFARAARLLQGTPNELFHANETKQPPPQDAHHGPGGGDQDGAAHSLPPIASEP